MLYQLGLPMSVLLEQTQVSGFILFLTFLRLNRRVKMFPHPTSAALNAPEFLEFVFFPFSQRIITGIVSIRQQPENVLATTLRLTRWCHAAQITSGCASPKAARWISGKACSWCATARSTAHARTNAFNKFSSFQSSNAEHAADKRHFDVRSFLLLQVQNNAADFLQG